MSPRTVMVASRWWRCLVVRCLCDYLSLRWWVDHDTLYQQQPYSDCFGLVLISFQEDCDLFPTLGAPFRKNASRNILVNSGVLSQSVEVCPKMAGLELLMVLTTLWMWAHVSNPKRIWNVYNFFNEMTENSRYIEIYYIIIFKYLCCANLFDFLANVLFSTAGYLDI